jgi:hypothetical protein
VTLSHLKRLRQEIGDLPDSGIPAQLKASATEPLARVSEILARESFFDEAASLATTSRELDDLVARTATQLADQQADLARTELSRWQSSADWVDLGDEDRVWFSSEVSNLAIDADGTLDGLKKLFRHDYSLNGRLRDLAANLVRKGAENRAARAGKPEPDASLDDTATPVRQIAEAEVVVPRVFKSANEIDLLIAALTKLRNGITASRPVRITWKEID